jgi:hypothetical protein
LIKKYLIRIFDIIFFREFIEDVLNLVNCKVLKYAQSATTDTYVLSESSMFVFQTHFVLKTCGETTLLHAVQPILELAREYCGLDIVDVRKMIFIFIKKQFFIVFSFSKSSIVVANFFDRNCKKHRTQVSNMKYMTNNYEIFLISFIYRSLISTRSLKVNIDQ